VAVSLQPATISGLKQEIQPLFNIVTLFFSSRNVERSSVNAMRKAKNGKFESKKKKQGNQRKTWLRGRTEE
jgi:hypothetical protein